VTCRRTRPTRATADQPGAHGTDAALETKGRRPGRLDPVRRLAEIRVEDEGSGLSTRQLVVRSSPPSGRFGHRLALSRQIAEGHSGSLTLENRTDRRLPGAASLPAN